MKVWTINRQILIWMLMVAVLPVVLLTAYYLYSYDDNFKKQTFRNLSHIADNKTYQMDEHIRERIRDGQFAAQLPSTKNALKKLLLAFPERFSQQDEFLQLQQRYSKNLQYLLEMGYYDIFLISPAADIVLTLAHEADLYTNLSDGPYASTELAAVVGAALALQEPALSAFVYYPPSKGLAAFIAVPVLDKGVLLGVIAFQIDIFGLQAIVESKIGLGKTGESNIVTIHNQRPLLVIRPVVPTTPIKLQMQPLAFRIGWPMQQALEGNSGQVVTVDHKGQEVLTIYRYLPFLHAGFVVKVDSDEALQELNSFWIVSLSVLFLILTLVVIIAYYLSRFIAQPISALTTLSTAIAAGKHELQLKPEGSYETKQLATSFNLMLQQVQHERVMLEQRVQKRTFELVRQEQHLALYRDQSPIATIEWDVHCRVIYWNKAAEEIFGYTVAEVEGLTFLDFMIPEQVKAEASDVWERLISDRGGTYNINENLTKDNRVITCEWHNSLLKDASGAVIGVTSQVLDVTERQRMAAVLKTLAESGRGEENLFNIIVRQLAVSQGVRYALVSQVDPENPVDARTLAVWANGDFMENFTYSLKGTPCENVTQQGACLYSEHVQELFPEDQLLVDMQAVCYFGVPLTSVDGQTVGILAILNDQVMAKHPSTSQLLASLAVRAANELERQQAAEKLQFAARIFHETHEGITLTDAKGIIVDVNPSFCKITGYSREEVIGKNPNILSSGQQNKRFYRDMWGSLAETGHWQGELWNRKKTGEVYAQLMTISVLLDADNKPMNYVGLFSDITIAKQQQKSLELMAHYDVLTGLPNRSLFADRFSQAIALSKRNKSLLAVCFIDLDEFKPVNDAYGHDIGDKVLVEVAVRIKEVIREQDTVSRIGGDEFTLLLGDVHSVEQCKQAMRRVHQVIAQDYNIEGQVLTIAASSGMTIYPLDSADPDTLIRHADSAMYQAKLAGRNRYHLFDASSDKRVLEHHLQLNMIAEAFDRNEFCLYYQPKVNMLTGKVFGVEALIRWIHPENGLIPPLDFLPYIEGSDLEIRVGNWVMQEALQQLDNWRSQGVFLEVSVNISAFHLQWPDFYKQVDAALARHPKISSQLLQFEILESSVLSDITLISDIIKHCRELLGVRVALDDFGTGYSSLTHLRRLSADTIKIDQSFIRDMLEDPEDYAIVEGVIGLAKAFRRDVIAEGVETKEHGLMLMKMGCAQAQGYGIARPMPAKNIQNWLDEYRSFEEWSDFIES
ncbi:MAG: hypothetical protein methR_P0542 [Methyloprofundus sp.]|nr:MAG: hypothetical protein methR_P0542 [Methyloprofundus sp.]